MPQGSNGDWRIEGSECPECLNELSYNGNYSCLICEWVLPAEIYARRSDEQLAFELAYILLMKQRGQAERIYLDAFTRNTEGHWPMHVLTEAWVADGKPDVPRWNPQLDCMVGGRA